MHGDHHDGVPIFILTHDVPEGPGARGRGRRLELHVVPVLLGQGRRLIDHLPPEHVHLELVRRLETSPDEQFAQRVLHLRYRVRRP